MIINAVFTFENVELRLKIMTMQPFKPIELRDKEIFDRFLKQDPPRVSELTFTNLFIASRIWGSKACAKPRSPIARIIWCRNTSSNRNELNRAVQSRGDRPVAPT